MVNFLRDNLVTALGAAPEAFEPPARAHDPNALGTPPQPEPPIRLEDGTPVTLELLQRRLFERYLQSLYAEGSDVQPPEFISPSLRSIRVNHFRRFGARLTEVIRQHGFDQNDFRRAINLHLSVQTDFSRDANHFERFLTTSLSALRPTVDRLREEVFTERMMAYLLFEHPILPSRDEIFKHPERLAGVASMSDLATNTSPNPDPHPALQIQQDAFERYSTESSPELLVELWESYGRLLELSLESNPEEAQYALYRIKVQVFEWITSLTLEHHGLTQAAALYREAQTLYPAHADTFESRFQAICKLNELSFREMDRRFGFEKKFMTFLIHRRVKLSIEDAEQIRKSLSEPFVRFLFQKGPLPPPGFPVFRSSVPDHTTDPAEVRALGIYPHHYEEAQARLREGSADESHVRLDALRILAGYSKSDLVRLLNLSHMNLFDILLGHRAIGSAVRAVFMNALSPQAIAFWEGRADLSEVSSPVFIFPDSQLTPEHFSKDRFKQLQASFESNKSGRWAIASFEDWIKLLIEPSGIRFSSVRSFLKNPSVERHRFNALRHWVFTPEAFDYLIKREAATTRIPAPHEIFKFGSTFADRFADVSRSFHDGIDSPLTRERFRQVLEALTQYKLRRRSLWQGRNFRMSFSMLRFPYRPKALAKFTAVFTQEALAYLRGESNELPETILIPCEASEALLTLLAQREPDDTTSLASELESHMNGLRMKNLLLEASMEWTAFRRHLRDYFYHHRNHLFDDFEKFIPPNKAVTSINLSSPGRRKLLEAVFSPQALAYLFREEGTDSLPEGIPIFQSDFGHFLQSPVPIPPPVEDSPEKPVRRRTVSTIRPATERYRIFAQQFNRLMAACGMEAGTFYDDFRDYIYLVASSDRKQRFKTTLSASIFREGLNGRKNLLTLDRRHLLEHVLTEAAMDYLLYEIEGRRAVPLPSPNQIFKEGFQQFLASK